MLRLPDKLDRDIVHDGISDYRPDDRANEWGDLEARQEKELDHYYPRVPHSADGLELQESDEPVPDFLPNRLRHFDCYPLVDEEGRRHSDHERDDVQQEERGRGEASVRKAELAVDREEADRQHESQLPRSQLLLRSQT